MGGLEKQGGGQKMMGPFNKMGLLVLRGPVEVLVLWLHMQG